LAAEKKLPKHERKDSRTPTSTLSPDGYAHLVIRVAVEYNNNNNNNNNTTVGTGRGEGRLQGHGEALGVGASRTVTALTYISLNKIISYPYTT
jgi:hypothetical protein